MHARAIELKELCGKTSFTATEKGNMRKLKLKVINQYLYAKRRRDDEDEKIDFHGKTVQKCNFPRLACMHKFITHRAHFCEKKFPFNIVALSNMHGIFPCQFYHKSCSKCMQLQK
jgi:hypothetical protein